MRHPNPGEGSLRRRGLQEEKQNLNRVHIAQIASVDTEHGTASVVVNGTAQKYNVAIPTLGLSAHSQRSSWMRYMPQNLDYVKLGFGTDGRPEVLSMATWGDRYSVSDAKNSGTAADGPGGARYIGGYAQVQSLANAGKGQLRDFVPLRQGEWDFRSSGNAYIHGSDQGRLLLAGGPSKIEIRKTRNEIESRTGLTVIGDGEGTALRLGDVKRKLLPTDFNESVVLTPPSTKEYDVTVSTGGLLPLSLYQARIGDVRDSLGQIELSPAPISAPVRARYSYYDATGLATGLEGTVDILGNVVFTHGAGALSGLSLTGLTGSLTTQYLSTSMTSTTTAEMHALGTATVEGDVAARILSSALVELDATFIRLGVGAIEPAIKGLIHTTLFGIFASACATAFGTIAGLEGGPTSVKGAAYTTIASAFTALATGLAGTLSTKVLVE